MSHISDFLERATPATRKGDITSAWECYTVTGKSGRVYKSAKKSYSRRVSYAADLIAGQEEEQNPQALTDLCRTQWKVYRVSPLWNVAYQERPGPPPLGPETGQPARGLANNSDLRGISADDRDEHVCYDEATLKRYARFICGHVIANQSNLNDMPNRVEMTPLKGLRGSRNDRIAIKVTVYSTCGDQSRLVFTGILCGVETKELQLSSEKATLLPVFLTQGAADVTDRVIFGLEKCFDCVIGPLVLPGDELGWMSSMWAGLEVRQREDHTNIGGDGSGEVEDNPPLEKKGRYKKKAVSVKKGKLVVGDGKKIEKRPTVGDAVKFWYTIPGDADGKLKHLTLSLPATNVKDLWLALHEESETEFTAMEMEAFHRSLSIHLSSLYDIDFTKLDLVQISLPFFQAHHSGRIRIQEEQHVKVVLRYLTELCQGDMLCADPTLSVTTSENTTMDWA